MATKETMIVFVYDTECLKDEADDPVKAVLYFHPSWVSDTQKVALCGQLMGTSYFLKDCFFKPRILALQNGKFILKEFGRFILAVGTDRNISDYLLQYRADLLASLVRLFHRDVQTIYDQFPLIGQYKNLSEKLYHIFETYLPILQHKGNIFQNIPKLRMPITGSNIFLDAMQTLQCCQGTKGVLGGAILYHNKVVATQLSDQITKQLVLTDPLHVRTTAEQLNAVNFHIPNGVQMIAIYIDAEQYQQLVEDSQRAQNLPAELAQSSTSGLNFSVPKRKMKRDQSFIFTNIPEEAAAATSAATEDKGLTVEKEDLDKDNACGTQAQEHTSALPPLPSRPKSQKRPNHLPLRSKNMTTREVPESGIASINFDENDSFPEFIGRTSVCSTPMPENRVFKLDGIISICSNPEDKNKAKVASDAETDNNRRRKSIKSDFEKFFQNFITNPYKLERRNSFSDLQDALKKISNKLSFKKTFVNTTKTDENRNGSYTASATPPDFIEHDGNDLERSDKFVHRKKSSHTITDPTYPVFNANGKPISRSLFQEFLDRYYNLWEADSKKKEKVAELMAEFKEFDDELKKLNDNLSKNTKPETSEIVFRPDKNLNIEKAKTPLDKKALSLPLKPLSDATPSESMNAPFGVSRKQPGGIPLTPLMAKLSVLASTEERSTASGFCSWDATPGAVDIQTPLETAKMFRRRNSNATMKCEEGAEAQASQTGNSAAGSSDGLQRVDLYICGQQNMTLLLLLEQGTSSKQPVVQSMFDICVAKFPQMENSLNEALSINVGGGKSDGEYSFMHIDSKWDTLHRSGAWNPVELNTLECMHRDFELSDGFMTELIVRSNDSAFYGHRYGRRTFFYKEAAHQTTGVPPPTDPMGVIPMRAKKRLERDHSYILL